AVEILRIAELLAIDGEQILTRFHIDARLGERRAERRIPVQATVDLLETIASVLDAVVRAEETARAGIAVGETVAAAETMVTDGELARQPAHHTIQILTDGNVRQELGVLRTHSLPIGAVHVGVVEVIAVD